MNILNKMKKIQMNMAKQDSNENISLTNNVAFHISAILKLGQNRSHDLYSNDFCATSFYSMKIPK